MVALLQFSPVKRVGSRDCTHHVQFHRPASSSQRFLRAPHKLEGAEDAPLDAGPFLGVAGDLAEGKQIAVLETAGRALANSPPLNHSMLSNPERPRFRVRLIRFVASSLNCSGSNRHRLISFVNAGARSRPMSWRRG